MRTTTAIAVTLSSLLFGLPAGAAQGPPSPSAPASAAAAAPAPAASAFTPIVRNTTRVETWRFFEPRPGGGDPDYTFLANRLLAGVRHTGPRHELEATLQYVQFGGLPDDAIGPGALGTGANYFDHNRRTDSRQVYVKALNLLVRQALPGLNLRVGRMAYASGGEAASGNPAIESLKRMRVDARLVGEFEWSIYQRAFDGARADWARERLQLTGAVLWPTQGGFEEEAGASLRDVRLVSGVATIKPSLLFPRTEVQVFAHHYDDERPVTARPDNTGRAGSRVDVAFTTSGAHIVGAYPTAGGRGDLVLWGAMQRGHWYESRHRAWAFAAETGYQWASPWSPWLRAGWNRASGDDDPSDLRHGTFMPPVPTARKYSLSTAYAFMNIDDLFAQVLLKPRPAVTLRGDVHRLRLADESDRWYAGSGATRRRGTIFGYGGRPGGGAEALGTVVEGSVDWAIRPRWSVNAYAGRLFGGDVVRHTFAGDALTFAYIEHVISLR